MKQDCVVHPGRTLSSVCWVGMGTTSFITTQKSWRSTRLFLCSFPDTAWWAQQVSEGDNISSHRATVLSKFRGAESFTPLHSDFSNMDPQHDQWECPGWPLWPCPQPWYPPRKKRQRYKKSCDTRRGGHTGGDPPPSTYLALYLHIRSEHPSVLHWSRTYSSGRYRGGSAGSLSLSH